MSDLADLAKAADRLSTSADRLVTHLTKPKVKSRWEILKSLTVPVMMLLLTTLVSVLMVPLITERSAKKKILQDTRVQKSMEIIRYSTNDSSLLNQVKTALDIFEKEAPHLPDADELKLRRIRLKDTVDKIYLEFDRDAWWWPAQIVQQAAIIDLIPEKKRQDLAILSGEYAQNLVDTLQLFEDARNNHLTGKGATDPAKVPRLMPAMHKAFYDLQRNRASITTKMVAQFQ